MKKYYYALLTTLMAVMPTMTFISCSGDDDNDDSGEADKNISYQKCPDNHHPHMIDLGLPSGTKWACCNVGADKPEAYGGYYAWGETEEKTIYNEVTYQYCTGDDTDGNGLYDKNSSYQDLGSDIASTQYDVAHVKWGGSWVMPSRSQIEELLGNCTSTWITKDGVHGRQFSGRNGGTIFLPATGYRWDDHLLDSDYTGNYWSSTQIQSEMDHACYLSFMEGGMGWGNGKRRGGLAVRPVIRVSVETSHRGVSAEFF